MDNMINEKCIKCDSQGIYWDFKDGDLISLCKDHIKIESSS